MAMISAERSAAASPADTALALRREPRQQQMRMCRGDVCIVRRAAPPSSGPWQSGIAYSWSGYSKVRSLFLLLCLPISLRVGST